MTLVERARLMRYYKLSRGLARLLSLLYEYEILTREAIEQAGGKHYRKCLSIIRESGIDVENLYGVGYRLSDKDRRDITSIINDEPEFRR
jgi:hypothetical protein